MYSLPSGSHTLTKQSISAFDQNQGNAIREKFSLDAFCGIEDDGQRMVTVEGIT